jgi:predicted AlkP superfamily phosphohydrolase/phosphomutase
MPRAILVILDGLRRDLVTRENTPRLATFAARSEQFAAHRTVFPSCTRVVSASLATGCHPARHGLQGNTMALMENGRLVRHDAGRPDFLQHKRRVTGRSLAMPTLAERLTDRGGAIIFSNVSPGAMPTIRMDLDESIIAPDRSAATVSRFRRTSSFASRRT